MITIQPQYLSLANLLKGRLFRIPEYQRAYSWTHSQRKDLFDDILKVQTKGHEDGHYMAAVVGLRRGKQILGTDEFVVTEVVDGQQRLTTLIILLNTIKLSLSNKDKSEEKLLRELAELLVKSEGEELLLLQTNHDSSHHFADFLRKGKSKASEQAKTLADKEILKAIEECAIFVKYWVAKVDTLLSLATLLKTRLSFLLHEIDDEKSVYTVFEVLNSRGLDVTSIDRLKSILMGAAFELENANKTGIIDDLHTIWRDFYAVVGLRQGMSTDALKFAATLRVASAPSKPLGEKESVEAMRSEGSNAKKIRELAAWLLQVAKACDKVMANNRINAVTEIAQARMVAVAIHLREDLNETEKAKLLSRWEKISFRIYGMLRKDARTRVGDYVRLAWQIVNEIKTVDEIDKAIRQIGKDFPIDECINALRNSNCYDGWQIELRYLLYRYEEHLSTQKKMKFSNEQWEKIWMVSPSESIEHIWPSSTAPDKIRHSIGNLVLLPPRLNSQLQDIDPRDKVEAYVQTGLLIAREVSEVLAKKGWRPKYVKERENKILEWAKLEWAD